MKKIKDMNIAELAGYISDYLESKNYSFILSGGSCVSIYTDNKYQSYDLDFIARNTIDHKKIEADLAEIGFSKDGKYYKHPDTDYFIEFPAPPPAVGNEPIRTVNHYKIGEATIRMLTPEDCIKDRLCAFFYWDDKPALQQAIMVAIDCNIKPEAVKEWAQKEGETEKFDIFKKEYKLKKNA